MVNYVIHLYYRIACSWKKGLGLYTDNKLSTKRKSKLFNYR